MSRRPVPTDPERATERVQNDRWVEHSYWSFIKVRQLNANYKPGVLGVFWHSQSCLCWDYSLCNRSSGHSALYSDEYKHALCSFWSPSLGRVFKTGIQVQMVRLLRAMRWNWSNCLIPGPGRLDEFCEKTNVIGWKSHVEIVALLS